jgi:hypothetical protein
MSCPTCTFLKNTSTVTKGNPAVTIENARTIWGIYDPRDAAALAEFFPKMGERLIREIADHINDPRLLEVAGLAMLGERYLSSDFSQITGLEGVRFAANPLSILFWDDHANSVRRIKTRETEMLHGPMEKMALRGRSLERINELLHKRHGFQIVYACSCCAVAVATEDKHRLYESRYYNTREGLGRRYDSDVLTVHGRLHDGSSIADVPESILNRTADFGKGEVQSYLRLAEAAGYALERTPVVMTLPDEDAKAFLRRSLN